MSNRVNNKESEDRLAQVNNKVSKVCKDGEVNNKVNNKDSKQ